MNLKVNLSFLISLISLSLFIGSHSLAAEDKPRKAASPEDARIIAKEGYEKYCGRGGKYKPGELATMGHDGGTGDALSTAATAYGAEETAAKAHGYLKGLGEYRKATEKFKDDPIAAGEIEKLNRCNEGFDQAAGAAEKQKEEANKSNEDKGSGGGMPDLSSLLNALKKDKKEEEQKKDETLDCSNPASASNPVCVCQYNPRGAGCGQQEQQEYSTAKKEKKSRNDDFGSPGSPSSSPTYPDERQPNKSAAAALPAGGGAGGVGGGSSGGGKSGSDNQMGAPMAKPPGVLEGTYGGGGGAGSRSAAANAYNSPYARRNMAIQRNLASVRRSPANDGMTGPHTNLWSKVRQRYMSVRSTLNP